MLVNLRVISCGRDELASKLRSRFATITNYGSIYGDHDPAINVNIGKQITNETLNISIGAPLSSYCNPL